MQLYGFSDFESQALPLSPNLYVQSLVTPGDHETQPLWLEVIIPEALPDACKLLQIGPDAAAWLYLHPDAGLTLTIAPDADVDLLDDAYAEVGLVIGPDAATVVDVTQEGEEADVVLGIRPQADVTLEIPSDGDVLLSIKADASVTIEEEPPTERTLEIGPDAAVTIDVEACDE
jgi:hypothetical protein